MLIDLLQKRGNKSLGKIKETISEYYKYLKSSETEYCMKHNKLKKEIMEAQE